MPLIPEDKKLAKIEEVIKAVGYMKCTLAECKKCKYEPFTECKMLCVIDTIINLPPEEMQKLIREAGRRKLMED